jgi:hypothetical protein
MIYCNRQLEFSHQASSMLIHRDLISEIISSQIAPSSKKIRAMEKSLAKTKWMSKMMKKIREIRSF